MGAETTPASFYIFIEFLIFGVICIGIAIAQDDSED